MGCSNRASAEDMKLLWAKVSSQNRKHYHPVLYHLIDVAFVTRFMWRECLPQNVRSLVEKDIGIQGQAATAVIAFLAGLHDLGKVSPAFQFQSLGPDLLDLQKVGLTIGPGKAKSHGSITTKELTKLLQDGNIIEQASKKTATILSKIVGAHHGVFAHDLQRLGADSLGDNNWASFRFSIANHLWKILNPGDDQLSRIKWQEPANPAIIPLLAGLTSVADWIGSNTDYFKFDSQSNLTKYAQLSEQRAIKALSSIGWLPAPSYANRASFEEMFTFTPNEMQCSVINLVNKQTEPFLLAIEAQMGQGKTEAALYAADYLLCTGLSRGLYIALPTQATSNAMFDRLKKDYLERRRHSNIQDNIQLVHGNALLDKLVNVTNICQEKNGEESDVSAKSWFTARKRSLLAPFGVGTIDQALLSVLQTRHWFVRLFGLANKVVIFDEVHAYDTYTSTLLDRLMEWLSKLDCSVILLSATLPKERLAELVTAYGGKQLTTLADYPRITLAKRSAQPDCIAVDKDYETESVSLEFKSDDAFSVADLVTGRLKNGGCAAVICNTVARSQDVHEAIENEIRNKSLDCELILFHARTPFAWRKEIEEEILRKFGKPDEEGDSPNRPHRAIVVATSVIEQSLDLDFDWILTDMAPIDLLLQRLGREHRHRRPDRPKSLRQPVLTIMSAGEDDGLPPEFANAGIYERYILLRSWLAIEKKSTIELPHDIDDLVQWVYGDDKPNGLTQEWNDELDKWYDKIDKRTKDSREDADGRLVSKPDKPERLVRSLSLELDEDDDNPTTTQSLRAKTRDGKPSIQIVCLNRQEDMLFPVCGEHHVKLMSDPDVQLTRELLASSLPVQNEYLYQALLKQSTPKGWMNNPHLRYHRAVEFIDEATNEYPCPLRLTRKLGLVIGKVE